MQICLNAVSIPYSTIKSDSETPYIKGKGMFQFLIVQLKVLLYLRLLIITRVSIPYSTIKRLKLWADYLNENGFNSL